MTDRTGRSKVEHLAHRALTELALDFELEQWTSEETALVTVGYHGTDTAYRLVWLPQPSLSAISRLALQDDGRPPLVMAPYITHRTAGNFRDAGLDYVDQAGNAHLGFGPVLIDIRGRPRPTNDPSSPENIPQATAANLFSARRMQVLFVLLAWPNAARMPVRTIADAAGTSVGITQSTLTTMRETDYLIGKNLHRRDELIDLWTAAFRGTLLPKIRQNSFSGEIESRSLPPGYLISGESAVENIRRPHTLVVYAERFDAMVAVENGWRKSDAPNIEIRRKFWSELPENHSGPRKPFAGSAAPPVLVYADLLTANEPRQTEVARTLRKDRLV